MSCIAHTCTLVTPGRSMPQVRQVQQVIQVVVGASHCMRQAYVHSCCVDMYSDKSVDLTVTIRHLI